MFLKMAQQADEQLDARDLHCPEPVMMLHKKMRELKAGDLLEVLATDPSTQRDIPRFCAFLEHQLVDQRVEGTIYYYYIRKSRA